VATSAFTSFGKHDPLAEDGHVVHEADARREHGVGCVLGQLGGGRIHEVDRALGSHERRVQLGDQCARFLAGCADDDAVRPHEVVDCRAFLEELGVGDDVDLRLALPLQLGLHPLGGTDRNGALVDDHRVALGRGGDVVGDAHDRAQIGVAVVALRRSDRDEDDLAGPDGGAQIVREEEALAFAISRQQLFEPRLVDGRLPRAQRG
jgi:hypothetical protein